MGAGIEKEIRKDGSISASVAPNGQFITSVGHSGNATHTDNSMTRQADV